MSTAVVLVFAVVFAVVAGAFWLFVDRHDAAAQRALRRRLGREVVDGEGKSRAEASPIERQRRLKPRPEGPPSVIGARLLGPLARLLDRAGMDAQPAPLLGLAIGVGLTAALVMAVTSPMPLVTVPLGLAAGWIPIALVRVKAARRATQFEEQFPEAIDLMARALRAGHAMTTGLALVAEELPDPVGAEFRLVYDRQNFGMSMPDALHLFAERVPLLDARFFVTAVLTQRESGGNLAEILDNLADVIRQRFRVKRQIKVVTAHARLSGMVLAFMPVVIALGMVVVAPDHILVLVRDPLGIQMAVGAGVLWLLGYFAIRRIVDVEYEVDTSLAWPLALVFLTTAISAGAVTALLLGRQTAARRRLDEIVAPRPTDAPTLAGPQITLTDTVSPTLSRVSKVLPTSPKELSRIRRRLTRAGFTGPGAPVVYAALEVALPVVVGVGAFLLLGPSRGLLAGSLLAIVAYLVPGFVVGRIATKRQQQIRNGLPDALDLVIVCVEAGLSLDQAVMKASDELALSHPPLAEELHHVTNEIRAGKPRMEAFRNFAERTKVDDVRALVAMLIQTDRFGTSIAKALRTHVETGRIMRRQRAEERAAKLGVKLVFPLVFCLFPAMYVVTLGPAAIRIIRVLLQGLSGQ